MPLHCIQSVFCVFGNFNKVLLKKGVSVSRQHVPLVRFFLINQKSTHMFQWCVNKYVFTICLNFIMWEGFLFLDRQTKKKV